MEPIDLPIADEIDVKTSSYFPPFARFGGMVFIVLGILTAFANIFIGAFFMIAGAFVATAHYRIRVDFNRGTYFDYSWILGFEFGERRRFEQIEYIFINKNKVSETARGRVASTTFTRYDYNGYLKFSDKEKIHLRSDADKTAVVEHMQLLAAKFKCQLRDYSED